jgi:hypothetical protein
LLLWLRKKERSLLGFLRVLVFSFILFASSSGVAFSQGVLLNQVPNQVSAYTSTPSAGFRVADNFILTSQETISQIRIWGTYLNSETPPLTDNFTVIFHTDAAGLPGAVISTENSVPVIRQATGVGNIAGSYAEYVFTLTLATPVTLNSGTYWVEIYNETTSTFYWETGTLDATHGISQGAQNNGTWYSCPDLAIEITSSTSIPTMNQWGMIIFMVLAGLGAAYYLRRQKKSSEIR